MAGHHGRRDKRGWFLEKYDPLHAGSIDGADSEPHDHAIKRAMHASYKIPSKADGVDTNPERTLFIGHLNALATSDDLKSCLSHYGAIESASVIRNKVTGISQRYGFVTFHDMSSALSLYRASRRHTISVTFTPRKPGKLDTALSSSIQETSPTIADKTTEDGENTIRPPNAASTPVKSSQPALVDFERSRVMEGWIPRRMGGGLGGKKESGQLRFGGGLKPFRPPFGTVPSSISPHLQDELCWHPASRINQDVKQPGGGNRDFVERSDRDRGNEKGSSRSRSPTRGRLSSRHSGTAVRRQDREGDRQSIRRYSRSRSRDRREDRPSSNRSRYHSQARDRDRPFSRSHSRGRRSDRYSFKGGDYRDHRDRRDYRG